MVVLVIGMLIELFVIMLMYREIEDLRIQVKLEKGDNQYYEIKIKQLENRIIQLNEKELPSWELDN